MMKKILDNGEIIWEEPFDKKNGKKNLRNHLEKKVNLSKSWHIYEEDAQSTSEVK